MPDAPAWMPSVAHLAALLPSRATGRFTGGGAAGTPPSFPDPTRVEDVIVMAASVVMPRLGGDALPAKFWDAARAVITLRAALTLEPAAWPEQARPDKSAWEQWKELYDDDLAGLVEAVAADLADGDGGPGSISPVWSFPPASCQRIPRTESPYGDGC